jgi:hypothetical protein
MNVLPPTLRRIPLRLAIVVLLSLLVAGACYGVSLSPATQLLVGSRGGPPAGRGANAATAPAVPAISTDPAAPMPRPAGGGGRSASLQRGLPELARNLGVIAALIVVVALIQFWLRSRRRPHASRSVA